MSSSANGWSTGLCDCFSDCKSCCLTIWCPCIVFGRTVEIVDKGETSCCLAGTLFTLLGFMLGCTWIYTCNYRSKLRHQYSLEPTPCHDCLVHWLCTSCALCQEYRELQNREFDMSLGWEGNVSRKTRGVAMAPFVEAGMKR